MSDTITAYGYKGAAQAERTAARTGTLLHRRQFALGPRPVSPVPGWSTVPLPDGLHFSHCPELRVSVATDVEGNLWYLLGLAVQTAADRPDPIREIAEASPATIQEFYKHWAGRWILLGVGDVHLDASGLLGCYYGTRSPRSSNRELWMSSSPAIMAEILGIDPQPRCPIERGYGMDWYPPPGSGIDGIRRLISTQVLDVSSGKVTARPLVALEPRTSSYEETVDEIQSNLVTALKNVSRVAERLWLPLTGGKDSRTLLAAARHAGITARPYTHHHGRMSHADRTFPQRLAAAVGLEHSVFTGGAFRPDMEELYDRHTARHCVERDRFYFSHDYFTWCRKGDVILRSHVMDVGRYGNMMFPVEEYGREVPDAEVILEAWKNRGFKYAGRSPDGFFPESLYKTMREWVAWIKQTSAAGVDWRDRFSIEQGFGGWASSIEQSLDLIDAERFYACNSHRFLGLALQVPEEMRPYDKPMHQFDLIKRMAPQLLEWPCNPPDPIPFLQRVRGKLRGLKKRLTRENA